MGKYLIALAAAASIAGFASQLRAQDNEARIVAMTLCNEQAQAQYPGDSIDSQAARAVFYKECMIAGGFKP